MNETLCQCQTTPDANERTTITMEIPVGLFKQLQEAAALAGIDYQDLLHCYAQQGLINSSAKLKREQFAEHAREVLKNHGVHSSAIEEIFNKFLY